MTEYKKGYAPDIFAAANSLTKKSPTAATVRQSLPMHKQLRQDVHETRKSITNLVNLFKGGGEKSE